MQKILKLQDIEKQFPGVKALSGVSFDVNKGSIHAFVGENGAGKSTLCKVIAGAYSTDSGVIEFDGRECRWHSPGEAKQAGIHIIYQEFVLFNHMNAVENIFFGYEYRNRFGLIDHKKNHQEAKKILARLGVKVDLNVSVSQLPVADQQMLEIAKALVHEVKLLILDEPTAVISGQEADLLFDIVRQLSSQGVTVIYISHRLEEIFSLCEKVTILKDGTHVATKDISDTNRHDLVSLMVGRELSKLFPVRKDKQVRVPDPVLELNNVSVPDKISNVNLRLHKGEILGIAGLIGAGRTELALAIIGFLRISSGLISVEGVAVKNNSVHAAIDAGIGYVTEDRKGLGLFMNLAVYKNVTAARLESYAKKSILNDSKEKLTAEELISNLRIACQGANGCVDNLSGGNQQKVLLARWIVASKKVLILDEPTRGIDVGAKIEIYRIIHELADSGLAILIISSELPEIIEMSSRVVVMREGKVSGELTGKKITEEEIMKLSVHVSKSE